VNGKGGGGGASRAAINDPNYASVGQATGGSGGDGIVIIRYLI
jgi:hypothetical protein